MTLGPKFFCSSKMVATRRRSKLWWCKAHQSKALDVSYLSSRSKRDLKHFLILQNTRSRRELSIPLKIIDLQNDFNILVAKQWKIRISVPMSYIRLFENLAVLEKWYGMESRSVMEPAVLLLVSLPCTIGIELRSILFNVVSRFKKVTPPAANHPKVSRLKNTSPWSYTFLPCGAYLAPFGGASRVNLKKTMFLIGLPRAAI